MEGKGLCIFSWEILDSCIHVNATYCTVIVTGQIHSFMETVNPGGSCLFQQAAKNPKAQKQTCETVFTKL